MDAEGITHWIELGLIVAGFIGGQVVLYVVFRNNVKRDIQELRERVGKNEECNLKLKERANIMITGPDHDKMQADCRKPIYMEFANIREEVKEIKQDMSNLGNKLDLMVPVMASMGSDVKHILERLGGKQL